MGRYFPKLKKEGDIDGKMSNVDTVCFDFKDANETVFLDPNEIVMICCLKNKLAEIYTTNGESYIIKNTLKEIESKLKGGEFFRSHKSFLVNLAYVKKIINNYVGDRVFLY